MSERDDYADLPIRPLLSARTKRRLRYGILVLILLLIGIPIFVLCSVKMSDRHYCEYRSIHRATNLAEASRIYYLNNPAKSYPANLQDLLNPPTGMGPFIDGPRDLVDGWDKPFRYALVPNADGVLEPWVWTEFTWKGKTTLIGATMKSDGTLVRFGLPND
jgi:hypothetical protein